MATVLALPGLPDLAEALAQRRVDVERFLAIRNSDEGFEFLRWVSNVRPNDIAALTDQWIDLRDRLGAWIGTGRGRIVRFLVSTRAGTIPDASVAASAIDGFLLQWWLPFSQPLTLLRHSFRSISRAPKS